MWVCAPLTQTHRAGNCPSPSWSHRGLAGHVLGFTAMGGDEGQAKQKPRLFCHRFQTLPPLQTPEHFQINKQDPQIISKFMLKSKKVLWDFTLGLWDIYPTQASCSGELWGHQP